MEKIRKIIADNLKRLRDANNLTQADVCNKCNFEPASYSRWENGKSWPDSKTIMTLSEMYKVSPSTFYSEDTIPKPSLKEALEVVADFHGYRIEKIKRSEDELTDMIASLDEDDRKLIIENIKTLSSYQAEKKKKHG